MNTVVSELRLPRVGESIGGAFYHLSLHNLQAYLSALWVDLVRSSEQWDQNQNIPHSPWIITHDVFSSIINPTVSPPIMLQQMVVSENTQAVYANNVDPSIVNNIYELVPTIPEDYHRRLLRTLRRGFILRLLLDNRDISSGSCHNMIWTIDHFVSTSLLILVAP